MFTRFIVSMFVADLFKIKKIELVCGV